jgi:hypothetical protein
MQIDTRPSPVVLRQFSAALIFFGALAAYRIAASGATPGRSLLCAAGVAGLAGLAAPAVMRWPYVAAMAVTHPVGWLVSRVLLALLYYGVITVIAFAFRVAGRNSLPLKPSAAASYWRPRQEREPESYFNQF